MHRLLLYSALLMGLFCRAQTGPAGVGDTTGSSHLVLWLRADTAVEESIGDIAESGDSVEFWRDLSGYGNDASQGTSAERPIFNGSAVSFTGGSESNFVGEYLSLAGIDARTVIFVMDNLGPGSSSTTSGIFGQLYSSGAVYFHFNSADAGTTFNLSFDGTESNTGRFARDGGSFSSVAENHSSNALDGDTMIVFAEYSSLVTDFIYLGALDNSGTGPKYRATYNLREMIVYDSLLSDCERKLVELYLSDKYSIAVDNDFFDESASGSNGVETDQGGIFKTNSEQVNEASSSTLSIEDDGFLTDPLDALFVGHNNETSLTYAGMPVGIEVMQSRYWWADYTSCEGNNGNVIIGIDLTALPPSSATAFRLITSASTDFSSGTLHSGGSLSGDSVYFTLSTTDLNDVYFCLGSTDNAVSELVDLTGPEDISAGIRLWLMADMGVEEADGDAAEANDDVEFWRDQSGNGADASQTSASDQPSFNGSAIQFRGTVTSNTLGEYMDLPSVSAQTIFAVIDNAADSSGIIHGVVGQALGASSIYLHLYTSGSLAYSFDGTQANTGRYAHNGEAFSSSGENVSGTPITSAPTISLMEWTTNVDDLAYLAGLQNNTDVRHRANYDLKEFIVYGSQLSDCERRKIEAYLDGKYDITTFNYTAPSASFSNDTATLLHRSTYSNLSSATSDQLRIEDVSFLTETADRLTVCHDDGRSISTDVPGSLALRLNRLWYADYFSCSSNTGTVTLKFLISGTDCSPSDIGAAADYRLLHSASTTMSGATVVSGASVNGDTVEFSIDVSLIADRYFTLGSTDDDANSLGIFAPAQVYEGIIQWLKPDCGIEEAMDDAAEASDAVYRWKDQSGSGNHAYQDMLALRPVFNGSAIVFDGDAASTSSGEYFQTQEFDAQTFIAVLEDVQTASGDVHPLVGTTPGASYTDIFLSSGGLGYAISFDGTSGATGRLGIGGQELTSAGANVGSTDYPDSLSILLAEFSSLESDWAYLGGMVRSGATDVNFRGNYKLRELIAYSRTLSCEERTAIEEYLSATYSIGLEYDVGEAIGDNGLSENTVTLHSGNTSATTSALFIEDVTQINDCVDTLWIAHDTASGLTPQVEDADMSGLSGDSVARWSRRWYALVKTNAADGGNVTITFDLDDYNDTVTVAGSEYRIITSASPWAYASLVSGPAIDAVQNTVSFVINAANIHQRFFTLATRDISASPLPVDWLSFGAIADGNQARLQWSTASESNSDYFDVQRSPDGENFTSFGSVPAAGNSSDANTYAFTDPTPILPVSFYRLRQVDFNGQFSFSKTIALRWNEQESRLLIRPNPVRDILYVQSSTDIAYTFDVSDMTGRPLLSGHFEQSTSIDLHGLSPGMYTLTLRTAGAETEVKKFLVE